MGGGSTGSDGVKLGPLQHMLAGAMSGAFADTLTHPLSTIKTRLQVMTAVQLPGVEPQLIQHTPQYRCKVQAQLHQQHQLLLPPSARQ